MSASTVDPQPNRNTPAGAGRPDGRSIVFSSTRAGRQHDLWVMRADGKTPRRITNTPGFDDWAAKWSPDGHIYTFNADGSELRQVTRGVVPRVATMTNKR